MDGPWGNGVQGLSAGLGKDAWIRDDKFGLARLWGGLCVGLPEGAEIDWEVSRVAL